jgi:hypothetical protein
MPTLPRHAAAQRRLRLEARRAGGDVDGPAAGTVTTVVGEALCPLALLLRWPPMKWQRHRLAPWGRPRP